ncbi:HD domain-containing protein [Pseudooceanicola sediminis]|uniref:5'-deoxynucleotidase n=1 Tax=Pseudooceanicola sediminis TaxID=2211117 RepID=A0A399J532_9RHOB|nr:HD domain-containing protein [Pseudooceanicola sediminis]KAA2316976.1 HD domain-containing protein [Puniceibacterium sp. HSS470]RII40573.1 HD domain-containing protein [Pseudooceanicola sediminis]
MDTRRLDAQLAFLTEADRLKSVTRASTLTDQSRAENTAEHSWQAALAALIFLPGLAPDRLDRILAMLLLHDLVEIDAGDQPIDLPHDADALARAEQAAAARLFALLPGDQGAEFHTLWSEFEANRTADARLAKSIDYAVPVIQVWAASPRRADHEKVARDNCATGRARLIEQTLPDLFSHLASELAGADPVVAARAAFVAEADRLKTITRATTLCDGSRFENSAEHSWHLALYALTLAEHAPAGVAPFRVIRMLLLHDLVEIDAGDAPIYAQTAASQAAMADLEEAAAARLFGLLPADQGADLNALWHEFEEAETPDARFAKALDRFQPPMQNIASDGVSWRSNNVTYQMVDARVGAAVRRSLPDLWAHVAPRIAALLD